MKILVIHGPNLQLLGKREPDVYGSKTLKEIDTDIRARAKSLGATATVVQSNSEGAIVDRIGSAPGKYDALIINPGAYTHTSVAILDALLAVELPVIEVHLSNIHKREAFRHHSYVSKVANGVLCGFGPDGYVMALEAMSRLLKKQSGQ